MSIFAVYNATIIDGSFSIWNEELIVYSIHPKNKGNISQIDNKSLLSKFTFQKFSDALNLMCLWIGWIDNESLII